MKWNTVKSFELRLPPRVDLRFFRSFYRTLKGRLLIIRPQLTRLVLETVLLTCQNRLTNLNGALRSRVPLLSDVNTVIVPLLPLHTRPVETATLPSTNNKTVTQRTSVNITTQQYHNSSVSDPYSLNPDPDPAKNLHPDPEDPWIRIRSAEGYGALFRVLRSRPLFWWLRFSPVWRRRFRLLPQL